MKKLILLVAILATTIASAQDGFYHKGKKMYPEKFAQTKTGDAFLVGLTYGIAKATTKSVLAKPYSRNKTEHDPSFKLTITPSLSSGTVQQGQLWSFVQSPDEFALIKFRREYKPKTETVEVKKKNGSVKVKKKKVLRPINRWLKTGEFGLYSGITTSPDPDQFINFDWVEGEKENTFIIETKLSSGEYGFIYIGNNTAYANQSVYTFSVDDKRKGYRVIDN